MWWTVVQIVMLLVLLLVVDEDFAYGFSLISSPPHRTTTTTATTTTTSSSLLRHAYRTTATSCSSSSTATTSLAAAASTAATTTEGGEEASYSLDDDSYHITIEYCTGCKWGLRSFWMAQEILTTFNSEPQLCGVTLLPSSEAGTFQVKCCKMTTGSGCDEEEEVLLWDRKKKGGFPELKEIKQLIRDIIDPNLYLGHSDTSKRQEEQDGDVMKEKEPNKEQEGMPSSISTTALTSSTPSTLQSNNIIRPHLSITYCTGCHWLYRAAWMGQELLLSTFKDDLKSLSLIPSRPEFGAKGGTFIVALDNDNDSTVTIWDRSVQGKFPDTITELKQLVRDKVNPTKDLGHGEKKEKLAVEEMDDDDAAEARRMFGVM